MRIAHSVSFGALLVASLAVAPGAQTRVPPPLTGAVRGGKPAQPPLLKDFITFSVIVPPPELAIDSFYKKYANAQGIPVVGSEKVPDAAILMARDIVTFMLSERPDLRKELMRKKWKVAVMAQTEVTYDIPEHRKYRVLPKIDDERLTPEQRANYDKPGGVGTLTGEQYWNSRGRGFGGEPDGENTTSCAEENLLGYPGTPYFGQPLLMHEFSHGIMRGAIYTVDPGYRKSVEEAYAAAKARGLKSAQGYNGNNFNEYWAGGVEYYTHHDPQSREILRQTDPTLAELVSRVMPTHRVTGNVYYGSARLPW